MRRVSPSHIQYYRLISSDLFDRIALASALAWLVVMSLLSWNSDIPLLIAVERGLVSSIVVYSVVFAGLHIMARLGFTAAYRREQEEAERRLARRRGKSAGSKPNEKRQ